MYVAASIHSEYPYNINASLTPRSSYPACTIIEDANQAQIWMEAQVSWDGGATYHECQDFDHHFTNLGALYTASDYYDRNYCGSGWYRGWVCVSILEANWDSGCILTSPVWSP